MLYSLYILTHQLGQCRTVAKESIGRNDVQTDDIDFDLHDTVDFKDLNLSLVEYFTVV